MKKYITILLFIIPIAGFSQSKDSIITTIKDVPADLAQLMKMQSAASIEDLNFSDNHDTKDSLLKVFSHTSRFLTYAGGQIKGRITSNSYIKMPGGAQGFRNIANTEYTIQVKVMAYCTPYSGHNKVHPCVPEKAAMQKLSNEQGCRNFVVEIR